jgi:hypothetical protein
MNNYANGVALSHQNIAGTIALRCSRHLLATPVRARGRHPRPIIAMIEVFAEENCMTTSQDISMYTASVPVLRQILNSLAAILKKAEDHVEAKKLEPNALLQARLFPDMFPLVRQVQLATDFAKGAAARLGGVEVPRYDDVEHDFAGLQARLAKTLAFIDSVPREAIEDGAARDITVGTGDNQRQFKGLAYLLHFALPHFYFHATTAYDILRHNGLDIGKRDFVGTF